MHVLSGEKPSVIDIQGTSLCQKGCNNTPSSIGLFVIFQQSIEARNISEIY